MDFGKVLVAKLEPCWDQMPPKPDPKTNQKNDCFVEGFQADFGWILAPKSRLLINFAGGLFIWLLGPSWRQDGPKTLQEAPGGAQDSLQDRFGSHFGGFLVDFLVVFWLVWGFISALVACCGVDLLPCWFVGFLVSWSVGSLLCWFSGLLVVCLSAVWPQSPRPGGGWPAGQLDNFLDCLEFFQKAFENSISPLVLMAQDFRSEFLYD